MIKSHPAQNLLRNYVAGDLNSASALVVATHVDMCPHCQRHCRAIEAELSAEVFQNSAQLGDSDMQLMLDAIFSSESATEQRPLTAETNHDGMISLEGKRFKLPRSLARQQARIGPWNKMIGNMWRASLSLGTEEVANLIYMGQHCSVPEHTHRGSELQVVINGTFSDEYGQYSDGDLLLLDGTHKHTPHTNDEDCLILAVMDAPLHFTSGISRLLNPFSNLFFR
ncbi:ChrR family anti-sigma-E factor [Aliidiomarina soli]|uniref:Transcriptional regulator n=1 Tax=Aliidiomarina soli TaxID=1928574 RepID=A0A432WMV4_9GAMM|nr:ChrR family anti-sigma-E factor [Aliidiomarina soli]RUO35061.1 transcriptional regulator [Aliidiomarina soli]